MGGRWWLGAWVRRHEGGQAGGCGHVRGQPGMGAWVGVREGRPEGAQAGGCGRAGRWVWWACMQVGGQCEVVWEVLVSHIISAQAWNYFQLLTLC